MWTRDFQRSIIQLIVIIFWSYTRAIWPMLHQQTIIMWNCKVWYILLFFIKNPPGFEYYKQSYKGINKSSFNFHSICAKRTSSVIFKGSFCIHFFSAVHSLTVSLAILTQQKKNNLKINFSQSLMHVVWLPSKNSWIRIIKKIREINYTKIYINICAIKISWILKKYF